VTVKSDITADTTWYNTNVYYMDGYIHVLSPAVLTIEPGTIVKGLSSGSITTSESASTLFVTRGAKLMAVGTPTRPIIFTTEYDDTTVPDDMGVYERGLWGGIVIMGRTVLNTSVSTEGNAASPKYDVFEGLPDTAIGGQNVYRFGGADDDDNSGVIRYVSIRHGGFQFMQNKELNGLSLCAVGRGTTIDHVECYAIADDGFEFFGGTVNTKYLVSAFNDDDAFDIDQGYRGKNQFWFAIQEDGKRDNGGEWNGEPNGLAVSNSPLATFEIYNMTLVGAGANGNTNVNHGLTIREYASPRVYNSILTGFNPASGSVGVRISDTRSGAMLSAGLIDFRENIVHGWTSAYNSTAEILFTETTRSNTTVDPMLVSISRSTNSALDPRLKAGSPALTSSRTAPSDGFYEPVAFKGAFDETTLWLRHWTALESMGFLPTEFPLSEPTRSVTVKDDITADTTWYNTNVYYMDGYIHVLSPAVLTIQPGTIIKGLSSGSITTSESASTLFVTRGAKLMAVGTPTRPIIFTSEYDDTTVPDDMGVYERGLWGGIVIMGRTVLNTAVSTEGNAASPKYDVFEGLPDTAIGGQNVYRFGGTDDDDNSGVIQYVSIRHGGFQFMQNKELNGLSLCAVGRGTTIDHVECYAIADDGFEFFGGTVNTKYLVSAFNDDDAFDIDQGYRGKNQFWFAIQEDGKRDNGGEWNGEPNGLAVSNSPLATFEIYNMTLVGAGANGNTNVNHGLTIREYASPRVYNSILTGFNPASGSVGVRISDTRSGGMLSAGLMDFRENIVHGWSSAYNSTAAPLFTETTRSNTTVDPMLVSISRTTNHALDPRLMAGSPASVTSRLPADAFYTKKEFKGAFNRELWLRSWTALESMGFLVDTATEIVVDPVTSTVVGPDAPTLMITRAGNVLTVSFETQTGHTYQLQKAVSLLQPAWSNEGNATAGTGGRFSLSIPSGEGTAFFRLQVQ
jgi:hypothetical protein